MLVSPDLVTPNRRALLSLTLCIAALVGCGGDDPGAGVLVVPYELGNMRDCESLGIVAVAAELDDQFIVEEVDCGAGEVRFDQVPADTYDVRLYGLDADGYRVMDSVEAGSVKLEVIGQGTTVVADPPVQLTAAPAQLLMRWDFGFSTCQSTTIDTFEVMAWRKDGSQLLMEEHVACGMQGEGVDQYRRVPDENRELAGDVFGEVSVQAIDRNDRAVGDAVGYYFETPGAGRPVKLTLLCDVSGCEGSGEVD